jgi:hypothetical protein
LSKQLEEAEKRAKAQMDEELRKKVSKTVLRKLDMQVLES